MEFLGWTAILATLGTYALIAYVVVTGIYALFC
jgi:hypothetical protein